MIGQVTPRDFLLVFEHFPVWFLVVEPSRVRHLYIVGFNSWSDVVNSLTHNTQPGVIVDHLLHPFDQNRVFYLGTSTQVPGLPLFGL
jgi:hypothetical protein